jgi:hypothetical protein
MFVGLVCVLRVVRMRSLRQTDHLPRRVVTTVARRMCDLENIVNKEAMTRVKLQHHIKKKSEK